MARLAQRSLRDRVSVRPPSEIRAPSGSSSGVGLKQALIEATRATSPVPRTSLAMSSSSVSLWPQSRRNRANRSTASFLSTLLEVADQTVARKTGAADSVRAALLIADFICPICHFRNS